MNLRERISRYQTIPKDKCPSCGNRWWFSTETAYECTTCPMKIEKVSLEKSDGAIHVIPMDPPNKHHDQSKHCWCEPTLDVDYTDQGGSRVYIHKEIQ